MLQAPLPRGCTYPGVLGGRRAGNVVDVPVTEFEQVPDGIGGALHLICCDRRVVADEARIGDGDSHPGRERQRLEGHLFGPHDDEAVDRLV